MTKEQTIAHTQRVVQEGADYIRRHPEDFVVCEGCERVIAKNVPGACQFCNGYRFDASHERVRERATFCADNIEQRFATLPRMEDL